ncbi:MAG: tetratricopeptide repeat protein [Acidiferrobacterales bacterium]|nr:tetratricopeptide repeat protein [Acidiferrobacterales bacterium]
MAVLAGCATSGAEKVEKWVPTKRADAHVSLGLDYLKRGSYEVALEEFDLAISINPNSDRAHHAKGLLSAQRGFVEDAKRSFAKAVRLNSSNFIAVNDYGIYQCQNGSFREGIDLLSSIENRQDNPLRTNTLLGLGICHYRQNKFEEAKPYLRTVLNVSPRLPQALLPLADMSYRESKFLNARAFIERYIAVGAISEQALVIGANTELQLGDGQKAKQYATELRRLYPTSQELTAFRDLLTNG